MIQLCLDRAQAMPMKYGVSPERQAEEPLNARLNNGEVNIALPLRHS